MRLTRFIRQLCTLPDTPSLIQFVAGDEDYIHLCSRIVNASAGEAKVRRLLSEICRNQSLDFQILKERLAPVGQALGLTSPTEKIDYYQLLGVSSDVRTADIKKAFRHKARKVHPDTAGEMTDNGQEFINLKAAYQILSDPVLRRQYDDALYDDNFWHEKTHQAAVQKKTGRSKIFYQLGVFFLLMILAVFILDFLYRQNSILDPDISANQKQVTERKNLKKGRQEESNFRIRPQSKRIEILRDNAGRALNNLPADVPLSKAKQQDNGSVSIHAPDKTKFEINLPK